MSERIKVDDIEMTGGGCPTQWEGETADGRGIYIRYRWGYLLVEIDSDEVYGQQVGDQYDGIMSDKELIEHTRHILDWGEEE